MVSNKLKTRAVPAALDVFEATTLGGRTAGVCDLHRNKDVCFVPPQVVDNMNY